MAEAAQRGRSDGGGAEGAPAGKRVLLRVGKARSRVMGASLGLTKTGGGIHGCSVEGTRKNSLLAEQ